MPKSTYLANEFLNSVLRGLTGVYVALYTAAPSINGGGTEVSGGSYTRQQVSFEEPSGGQSGNTEDVLFPIASSDWGILVAYGLFDSLTAGNLLYFSVFSSPRNVVANDQVKFTAGQLVVIES